MDATDKPMERKLSELLWDIEWGKHFPRQLTADGIRVEYSSYDEIVPFIRENYAQIFQDSDDSPFYGGKVTAARSRYYKAAGDFFTFKDGDTTAGLLIGTPVDWSTYYLRSLALLPKYEARNLMQRLLPHLVSRLKEAQVERIEAETAPSNMPMVYMLTRQRFNASGTVLSERWGVLTRFTKFLDDTNERVFLRQFCAGVKYQQQKAHRGPAVEPEAIGT